MHNSSEHLAIQYFFLMIDTFHVHSVKILCDEFFTQTEFLPLSRRPLQYFIPTVGLENGNVVILFILTYPVGDFHTLAKQLHQFVIEMIDLLPQFFKRSMILIGIYIFLPPYNRFKHFF